MKKIFLSLIACCVMLACQKSIDDVSIDNGTSGTDSKIRPGDTITYEIITADTTGWAGMWNEANGLIASNELDNVTFGSPVYYPSGWRHSFICPSAPFQAFISAATVFFDQDITANLYKNGDLIKTVTNDAMKGVTKLLVQADTDSLTGTASNPALTYEVLISGADLTKFEPDAWTGQWNIPDGKVNDLSNPLLGLYAIPGGWRYSFKPDHLPFTMYVGASPYTPGAAIVTVNFYVNGSLVKTVSSQNYTYGNTYVVQ